MPTAAPNREWWKRAWNSGWVRGALLVALTLAAYWPALHAGFIWDDDDYVTGNQTLRNLEGLRQIWFRVGAVPQYYPLVHTTFWLEYHLWGLNPFGYHLVNVCLHAFATILLWRVLTRLEVPDAWLAAGIFALHPVQVESVAWITERKNVLSTVLYLAAAWMYLRFVEWKDGTVPGRQGWRYYYSALALFVTALLSKTVACTLPAALLLVRWWKKGRLHWSDFRPLLPFFVFSVLLGSVTAWMERHHVGAQGADFSLTILDRCLLAGRAVWFYAGKLIWPAQLTFVYPRWVLNTGVWWQWLFPIAAISVVTVLWLARHRIHRGPLTAVLFFVGTLAPALGFINVYPFRFSFVADHFQYLASIGLIALAGAGIAQMPPVGKGRLGSTAPNLLGAAVVAMLGVLTWRQSAMYADIETLFRMTIERNPSAWMAHNNLGVGLIKKGQPDEALWHFQKALEIKPDLADAQVNFGNALLQKGQVDEAIVHYEKAVEIKPNYAAAHNNLGSALLRKGQVEEAIAHYKRAVEIKPDYAEAWFNLGSALLQNGGSKEAVGGFEKALAIKRDYAEAHYNIGNVLAKEGRLDEALSHYEKAVQIKPDYAEANYNLGNALLEKGRVDEAIVHYQSVLAVKPDSVEACNNLGTAFLRKGQLVEAIAWHEKAIEIKPDYAEAHYNLGAVLLRAGQVDQAFSHFRKAMEIQPSNATIPNNLAWLLATSPDASQRNGVKAVEFAQEAVALSGPGQPSSLDTLAASYAELGNYQTAIDTGTRALELAKSAGDNELSGQIEQRLNLYRHQQPYREPRK